MKTDYSFPNQQFSIDGYKQYRRTRTITRGGFKGSPVFRNHFEGLQTMLFEAEVIINNVPLIYVYPNAVETCLTPNYLLFGRQLLLSSNTTSTVAANLTVLSSTTDRIIRISYHFWDRWRHEYAVNLSETQRISN